MGSFMKSHCVGDSNKITIIQGGKKTVPFFVARRPNVNQKYKVVCSVILKSF